MELKISPMRRHLLALALAEAFIRESSRTVIGRTPSAQMDRYNRIEYFKRCLRYLEETVLDLEDQVEKLNLGPEFVDC